MANSWFRLYSEFANDPKVQEMDEVHQRRLIMIFCLKCSDVLVTLRERSLAFHLRITEHQLAASKAVFVDQGFIDEDWNVLNWNKRQYLSDSSTDRTRRYRERVRTSRERHSDVTNGKCDGLDTDTDTEQIHKQKKKELSAKAEEIYQAYPRKIGRANAIKSILRACTSTDAAELLRATVAFAASPAGQNGKYTPHPATWFNQARYQDDPKEWEKTGENNGHRSAFDELIEENGNPQRTQTSRPSQGG